MFKKNRYLLLIIFIISFLSLSGGFAHALEITEYPPIPGLVAPSADCTGSDCLSIYIAYWFGLLIYIAGSLALISFTVGAVGLISPNIEAHNDAKDRMKGSVLGLVLTLSAFIILKTINPALITPSLTPLPGVAGVFYTNDTEDKPVGLEESNVANRGEDLIKNGFDKIIYKCVPGQENIAPTLLVWKFPKINFLGNDENYSGVNVERISCGKSTGVGGGSFKMAFETPGIYYFLGQGCSGYMSGANLSTQETIPEPFVGKIKSVRIVNDPKNHNYYAAIFHEAIGEGSSGDCTNPVSAGGTGACGNLSSFTNSSNFAPFSADIFVWNKDNPTPTSSGDGVTFYSEPDGWNSDKQAGQYNITNEKVRSYISQNSKKTTFDWNGVNSDIASACDGTFPACSSEEAVDYIDCCPCENFQDCPGSLRLKGSYLAAFYTFYSDKDGGSHLYCQTFTKDAADLSLQSFLPPGVNELDHVDIIPIK